MPTYIVDTSILIQHFVEDTNTTLVDRLVNQLGITVELIVPDICLAECTNVLWKRVRFGGVLASDAELLLVDLLVLPLTILPASKFLPRALQIGLRHSLAIYDSVYIALAESMNYPLITADSRQGAVSSSIGVTIKSIQDF